MSEIPAGAMRFNSDSQKLEYWKGSAWFQVHTATPNLDGGARGLYAGGSGVSPAPGARNEIDYINIATTGNALDFGSFGIDATTNYSSGCSSGHGGLS